MKEPIQDGVFTGYEYTTVKADATRLSFYLDCYRNFGWEQDETAHQTDPQPGALHLKRSRKLINRTELTRLQRNFEACVAEIDQLERRKKGLPSGVALASGLIGTAFIAGSVFAVTAAPPIVWLCVLLAIPGFAGWIASYFLYHRVPKRQTEVLDPLIESNREEIDILCEKGHNLL